MRQHALDKFWTETHQEYGMSLTYQEHFVRCMCGEVFVSRHPAAVRAFHRQHAASVVERMHEVGRTVY